MQGRKVKGNMSHLIDANDVRFKLQPDGQDVGPERLLRIRNNLGPRKRNPREQVTTHNKSSCQTDLIGWHSFKPEAELHLCAT